MTEPTPHPGPTYGPPVPPGAVPPVPVPPPPGSPYAPPATFGGPARSSAPTDPYARPSEAPAPTFASPDRRYGSPSSAPVPPYGAPAGGAPAGATPAAGSPVAQPSGMPGSAPPSSVPGVWGPSPGVVPGGRQRAPRGTLGAGTVAGVLVLGLLGGAVGAVGTNLLLGPGTGGRTAGTTVVEVPGTPSGGTTDRAPGSVAGVAAAVLPSVVSLEVRGQQGVATGSGFVYSADGFVITNNHVVAGAARAPGASSITVTFSDGTESEGTVVGRTEGYDLAVVKVERDGLVPLTLGDSEAVVVGDPVIAIGAPLGLEGTVTTGIVSALNRPVTAGDQGSTSWINALQTDAAINPGNSGGPLVNLAGEVVGVNSAIAQAPGSGQSAAGSIGLGFAIPANQVRRTAQQLIETGRATRPIIGALIDNRYTGEGVRVVRSEDVAAGEHPVTPGGPADKAGIKPGDVIVAIDGRPVTQEDELLVAIRARAPGDEVVLTIRDGDTDRDVTVVLDEAAAD